MEDDDVLILIDGKDINKELFLKLKSFYKYNNDFVNYIDDNEVTGILWSCLIF